MKKELGISFTFPREVLVATSDTIWHTAEVNFVDAEQVKAMDYNLLGIS